MKPNIYIILPVHNRKEITQRFIGCLKKQTISDYHLVLIDDGSSDGTSEMVKENIAYVTVIRGSGNWWWAGCLQKAREWLSHNHLNSGDIIITINDDVIIDNDFIEVGVKELNNLNGAFLQAKIYCQDSNEILDTGIIYKDEYVEFASASNDDDINCLTTNGLFMRWGDMIKVGNFHPILLPHYLSDYEFTIRAKRKGIQLCVSPNLKIFWDKQTTAPRSFNNKNFFLFLKSYFSKKSPMNPIYWSTFVLLVSKPRNMPINLTRIWRNAIIDICCHAISSIRYIFNGLKTKA